MKFSRYLAILERDAPARWRGKFIRYKALKKMLKAKEGDDTPLDATIDEQGECSFFNALQAELAAANCHFQAEAEATITDFRRTVHGTRILCCFIPLRRAGPHQCAALADRAYWCRKYARANAVALRKILKKHDKLCRNDRGRRFLQECWCSSSALGVGLFLHSPLLDELKAVQDVLQRKADQAAAAAGELEDSAALANAAAGTKTGGAGEATQKGGSGAQCCKTGPVADAKPAALRTDLPLPSSTTATKPRVPPERAAAGSATPAAHGALHRPSPASTSLSSDTGLAMPHSAGSGGGSTSLHSVTSPSLAAQRDEGLGAIAEDPACMLDSSDIEWVNNGSPRMTKRGSDNSQPPGPEQAWRAFDGALALQGPAQQPHPSPKRPAPIPEWKGVDPDAPILRTTPGSSRRGGEGAAQALDQVRLEGSSAPVHPPGSIGGSSGTGLGPFSDEELRCPICLDIMFKPVGLGCGHKFCRPCALEAAGFGSTVGAFHNIVQYIPTRTPCPHCRQTHVYRSAVPLKEVGLLIRSRYPEHWEERRMEEKRRQSSTSASQAGSTRRRAPRTARFYEMLLGTAVSN